MSLTHRDKAAFVRHSLLGHSAAMAALHRDLAGAGGRMRTGGALLFQGEPGTGKELCARVVHHVERKACGELWTLDPLTSPPELLERELRAPRRPPPGSQRSGRCTLWLKEVGLFPARLQQQVLRFLDRQGKDARVMASTSSELDNQAQDRSFHPELLARLGGQRIELPPLRVRLGDVPVLAASFASRFGKSVGRPVTLAPGTLDRLVAYRWPGNVSELSAVVRRLVLASRSDVVEPDDAGTLLPGAPTHEAAAAPAGPAPFSRAQLAELAPLLERAPFEDLVRLKLAAFLDRMEGAEITDLYQEVVSRVERPLLQLVLQRAEGNQVRAASELGLSRNTLRKKLTECGLMGTPSSRGGSPKR
jgi:two-component system nitrogen regulation response regulator GlnG